jgi:hypothetical protein
MMAKATVAGNALLQIARRTSLLDQYGGCHVSWQDAEVGVLQ